MRISRTLSIGTGIAIVAVSALLVTSSAVAEVPKDGVYVNEANFSSSGWMTNGTSPEFGLSGANFFLGNVFVVLKDFSEQIPVPQESTVLAQFAQASLFEGDKVDGMRAYIELNVNGFIEPLVASSQGNDSWTDPAALWTASTTFGTISAGDEANLQQFADQFTDATAISSAGFEGYDDYYLVSSMMINGTSYLFTPMPVSEAPTSISTGDFTTSGFNLTTNGFVPGEPVTVTLGFSTDTSDGSVNLASTTADDKTGAITYNYVWPTGEALLPGNYRLTLESGNGTRVQFFDFVVSQSPIDALAATGAEPMGLIAAAGAFGLVGAGVLAAIAIRRKKATRA